MNPGRRQPPSKLTVSASLPAASLTSLDRPTAAILSPLMATASTGEKSPSHTVMIDPLWYILARMMGFVDWSCSVGGKSCKSRSLDTH